MCDWEKYYKINLALLVGIQLRCNDAERSLFSPNQEKLVFFLLRPFCFLATRNDCFKSYVSHLSQIQ